MAAARGTNISRALACKSLNRSHRTYAAISVEYSLVQLHPDTHRLVSPRDFRHGSLHGLSYGTIPPKLSRNDRRLVPSVLPHTDDSDCAMCSHRNGWM